MLSKKEQEYLLSQYKKYNMPVYYWTGMITEHDEFEPVVEEVDSVSIAEDIWDCL